MKKFLTLVFAAGVAISAQAIDIIYRGNSTDDKDIVCYFQGGRFYADKDRKQCLYHHPGNMVAKEEKATAKNAIYRLMSDKIYKGYSINKDDCIATIFETRTSKGNTVGAKVYPGFVMIRDKVGIPEGGGVTGFKTTRDNINPEEIPALFTIEGDKIYKGDSTDPADCVFTLKGNFNSSRLLFIVTELK